MNPLSSLPCDVLLYCVAPYLSCKDAARLISSFKCDPSVRKLIFKTCHHKGLHGKYCDRGICQYYEHGLLHREDDKPAIKELYQNYRIHQWYTRGNRTRAGGKPAYVDYTRDIKRWYENDMLHRLGKPAVTYGDSPEEEWYAYGRRHRVDGYAAVHWDGNGEYWILGHQIAAGKYEGIVARLTPEQRAGLGDYSFPCAPASKRPRLE